MSALESISTRLVYTEDQALLRDEARRLLAARVSIEAVRALLDDDGGDDPALWAELGRMGWLGLLTEAEYGGAGLGAVELSILAEEAGRTLLPTPILAHLLATAVLARGGSTSQRAEWLPRLATGELRATWAHVEANGAWRVADTSVASAGGRLHGTKAFVWAGNTADVFLVPVQVDEEVRIALVPSNAAGVRVESEQTLDRTRRQGRLVLVDAEPVGLLERPAAEVEQDFLPLAWTAIAAESVGGAAAALDRTAAYAATREQFGKAIGSFQAIKHPLVNVLIDTEQARSLVYAAACAIDQSNDDAVLLARMAKARSSDAYGFATSRAIQFHGGFGFTEECDAHLFRRRALASRPALGDPDHHRAAIADLVLGPSAAGATALD
ncbi:MAG: acyl-CoA dehydrogenase family protein [Candidatus Binatia bacterium]|nr:acyl-CoA dehydrogenase family protein [Candidatus Binatia bacterium]